MSAKTNKSFSKRLKVRRSGKVQSRKAGFNHFNAKQSRRKQLAGKKMAEFIMKPKIKSRNLPHA